MTYETLLREVDDDGVATLTLNRPERLNALNPAMRRELCEAIVACGEDEAVRAVVITGAGRGFCSGGDVKAMSEDRAAGVTASMEEQVAPPRDRAVLAMRDSPKPLIAAVNGAAAGAGMNIALGCDIRVASTAARFGQSFVRRGLHPDWGGTYLLPRVVGMAKACELIFTGRMVDADEALALGIVSRVTEPDDLMAATLELARRIAAGPPIAIRLARRALYRSMSCDLREALEFETYAQNICRATEDAKEGIAAFVEKRDPVFKGR